MKRKLTADEAMMSIRIQVFQLMVYHTHSRMLHADKQYFRDYCKKVGVKERAMRMILNGTYDGTLPNLIALAQRQGVVCDIKFEKNK